MSKVALTKPLMILLYGFPGAGKSHFARQLAEEIGAAHIQSDRIRHELFEKPRHDKSEETVIDHLMEYMAVEFLNAGVSVIFDINASRLVRRRELRDIARKAHAQNVLIWVQIDAESAFARLDARDRRKNDDKYATDYTRSSFDTATGAMQNPQAEDYIVISGKHTFKTQQSAVIKRLYDMGLISANSATANVVKPGLVNLVPNASGGRVDNTRRNIIIR